MSADVEPGDRGKAGGQRPPGAFLDPQFLKRTIERTLTEDVFETVTRQEIEALKAVALRHRRKGADPDSIAVDLVRAILASLFPGSPPEAWMAASAAVADALREDPTAGGRIDALWRRLNEDLP
jgi:hypothetical protein